MVSVVVITDEAVATTTTYDSNGEQTGIAGTAEGETVNRAFTYTPAGMLASYTDGTAAQTNLKYFAQQRGLDAKKLKLVWDFESGEQYMEIYNEARHKKYLRRR